MSTLFNKTARAAISAIALFTATACGGSGSSPSPTAGGGTQTPTPSPTPSPTPPPQATHDFSAVTQAIEDYSDDNFAVLIGTKDGQIYSYTKGNFSLDGRYMIASASKWLTSATIMRLVDEGTLSLSDRPQDHLGFWTADLMDPRADITLEHLLSFTSGFNQNPGSLNCQPAAIITVTQCAQQVYNDGIDTQPGFGFAYGPEHMQIAAAMAEAATGMAFADIVRTKLAEPLGMSENTDFVNPTRRNPLASGGAESTANDYALFLTALLDGRLVADPDLFLAERTSDKELIFRPGAAQDFGDWQYALGSFLECDKPEFDESCAAEAIYSSPGAFGWTPWIDRNAGYWGIVARRGDLQTGGIGVGLAQILQPLIEDVLDE